jgi:3-deoxy-D-manno-octulosonate 8-phosphate phosphatase KdsC-like HAD superfamily phosphatase
MSETMHDPRVMGTAKGKAADGSLIPVTAAEAQPHLAPVTHIYTDLDGTLFAPGGKLLTNHANEPSTATAEALVALKRAGIEVIVVTGRNGTQGHELLRTLDLEVFIGELGCLVMEGFGARARISYELGDWTSVVLADGLADGLPDERTGRLPGELTDESTSGLALGELPEGLTPYRLIERSGVIERLLAAFPGKLEAHFPYPNERMVTHAFRGLVDREEAARLLARERLPLTLVDNGEIHPQVHTLVDCPEIHIYHLMPRGVSKASAVAADIARRGLRLEQTLAIGDAKADMEMGEHTGTLVVMANALRSATVRAALDERHARGAVTLRTEGSTADGWAEFANALLAAR